MKVIIAIAFISCLSACKTTSGGVNKLDWGSDAEKKAAVVNFENAIYECVPLITSALPNVKILTIRGDKDKEDVVRKFVEHLVNHHDNDETESSAQLLEYYKREKSLSLALCGGEANEFVLTAFATHSNLIQVVMGDETTLKLSSENH